jgi:hypothetical protein
MTTRQRSGVVSAEDYDFHGHRGDLAFEEPSRTESKRCATKCCATKCCATSSERATSTGASSGSHRVGIATNRRAYLSTNR